MMYLLPYMENKGRPYPLLWGVGFYLLLAFQPLMAQQGQVDALVQQAQTLLLQGDFGAAMSLYRQAHALAIEEKQVGKEIQLLTRQNEELRKQQRTPLAARKLDSVLSWLRPDSTSAHQRALFSWLLIQQAFNHYQLGHDYTAISYYERGLEGYEKVYRDKLCPELDLEACMLEKNPNGYPDLWKYAKRPLSRLYAKIGDMPSARDHLPREDLLTTHTDKLSSELLYDIYTQYGNHWLLSQDTSRAYAYFRKAYEISALPPEHRLRSQLNYGNATRLLKQYAGAERLLTATTAQLERLELPSDTLADLQLDARLFMAYLYRDQGQQAQRRHSEAQEYLGFYRQAENWYARAGQLLESLPDSSIAWEKRANFYWNMGEMNLLQGRHEEAIPFFYRSLQACLPGLKTDSLPGPQQLRPRRQALYALEGLADAWRGRYHQSGQLNYLQQAVSAHQRIHAIEDSMRYLFRENLSRSELGQRSQKRLDKAIQLASLLWHATGDPRALDLAYAAIERSRASELKYEAWQKQHSPYLNQDLLNRFIFSKWEYQQARERNHSPAETSLRRSQYLQLWSQIMQQYPAYFREQPTTRAHIQARLKPGELMVAYFQGRDSLYQLYLSAQSGKLLSKPWQQAQQCQLAYLKDFVRSPLLPKEKAQYERFGQCAYQWYQLLLGELEQWQAQSLIIIPHRELSDFPFEVLVTQPPPTHYEIFDFRHLSFLFLHIPLSYEYVPALLQGQQTSSPSALHYVGFAPDYSSFSQQTELASRSQLDELVYNQQEVERVYALFEKKKLAVQKFVAGRATKDTFLQYAPASRLLHLAMHSQEDTSSYGLLFADDREQGVLQLNEIYQLPLRAECALLSACNTGLGAYLPGEGLISLGRAFRLAGCRAVVTSLWNVDDQSSATISRAFFAYLEQGYNKAEALQRARMDYFLSQSVSIEKAAPYYWAQMVVYGATDAMPSHRKLLPGWPWLLLLLAAGGGIWLWRRRKNPYL